MMYPPLAKVKHDKLGFVFRDVKVLAIITIQQNVATGILFIVLFGIGHCIFSLKDCAMANL